MSDESMDFPPNYVEDFTNALSFEVDHEFMTDKHQERLNQLLKCLQHHYKILQSERGPCCSMTEKYYQKLRSLELLIAQVKYAIKHGISDKDVLEIIKSCADTFQSLTCTRNTSQLA